MSAQGSSLDSVSFVRRAWRGARWVLLVVLVLYVALVFYRVPAVREERLSKEMVAKIEAQKLTIGDVDGSHLPPPPDPAKVDATVAGIDANGNGIRDDVELAIFAKYPTSSPTSTAIRAAELQYAMELQNFLGNVFDSNTLVAVMQQEGRGYLCIGDTQPKVNLSDSEAKIRAAFAIGDARIKEVENLVFDTEKRKVVRDDDFERYMTSFASLSGNDCDISPTPHS